jgi:squalene synthase HpnC
VSVSNGTTEATEATEPRDDGDPAAKAAGENFPVALRMLPRRYRRHLMSVYRFARLVDDVGDEGISDSAARIRLLDSLDEDVTRIANSTAGSAGDAGAAAAPGHPVIRGLAPTVRDCGIPLQPFRDLIEANRLDQAVTRYQTFDDLLGYCKLSANPVGRIVLHIFGVSTEPRERLSDQVCTALQLAEHWQDVAEDFGRGRIYIPREDMVRFGCTEDDLAAKSGPSGASGSGASGSPVRFRALMAFETQRAAGLLDDGAALVGTLRGAARLAVAGYVAGGRAALAAVSGHDVLRGAPHPGKGRVAAELGRAYLTGR